MTTERWSGWVASLGGVGLCPVAPATAGSVVAAGMLAWVSPGSAELWFLLVVTCLALWSIPAAERVFDAPDARPIVIDEVVGMAIAVWHLPRTWPLLIAAFFLFRGFDILKPPPLRQLERLPSPWGVLLDDVGAGLYVNLLLQGWLWTRGMVVG